MGQLSRDLISSTVSRAVSACVVLVATPVYLRMLGAEAYGLVGFYASLLACTIFLEQIFSPLIIRTLASSKAVGIDSSVVWCRFVTFEKLVVGVSVALGLAVLSTSGLISSHLLSTQTLTTAELLASLHAMALLLLFQWPTLYYGAALAGLSDQVFLNTTRAMVSMVQWGGGILLLTLMSPSVALLFYWHAFWFFLQGVLWRRRILVKISPVQRTGSWDAGMIREGWRYALGTLTIGITGTILTQADKFWIAKQAPLAEFAAYSLSFTAASVVTLFIAQPAMAVALPHFVSKISVESNATIAQEYRRWTQLIVLCTVPLVGILVFHTEPLLQLWFGSSSELIRGAINYVPLVALGTLLNVLMMLPFNMQLAHGWSSLSARKNLVAAPVFLALLWYLTPRWGPITGAWLWLALNLGYFLIEVPLMHRRILKDVLWPWWIQDTTLPCLLGLLVFWSASSISTQSGVVSTAVNLVLSASVTFVFLALTLPAARALTMKVWLRITEPVTR